MIWVAPLTVKEPAGVPPKLTAVAPLRFAPVMVTLVPPAAGPVFGLTLVTVGGETLRLRLAWEAEGQKHGKDGAC